MAQANRVPTRWGVILRDFRDVDGWVMKQTLARIGTGLSAIGALTWVLWPLDWQSVLQPEPLFAFTVALVVWIATEIKFSEEVQLRNSSPNDIRVAKKFAGLHANEFRHLLKDHEFFGFIDQSAITFIGQIIHERSSGSLIFQNKEMDHLLGRFLDNLNVLYRFIAQHTAPEMVAGSMTVSFKPRGIFDDEEYNRNQKLSWEADALADVSWKKLETLVAAIHQQIPEVLDEPF